MGSQTYRSEIARPKEDLVSLQSDLAKQEDLAAKARAEAAKKRKAAINPKSISIMQSNLRSAETEDKKVVAAERELATFAQSWLPLATGSTGPRTTWHQP
jgi:hypothetical protein